jgi:hypothetical protein
VRRSSYVTMRLGMYSLKQAWHRRPERRIPGLISRGRDCRSRLGSFAMTGLVFLPDIGRPAAAALLRNTSIFGPKIDICSFWIQPPFLGGAGLAMTTIFTLSPFVAALGHKNSGHCEEERRGNLHCFLPLNAAQNLRVSGSTPMEYNRRLKRTPRVGAAHPGCDLRSVISAGYLRSRLRCSTIACSSAICLCSV